MKLFKYATIVLVVAIITDITVVLASEPSGLSIARDLVKNEQQFTEYRTKDTWTTQTYRHVASSTWLTNPCTDCKVASKPYTSSGDVGAAVVTVAGETKRFDDPSSMKNPDTYRLQLWRFDGTLLTTHHSSIWMINPSN